MTQKDCDDAESGIEFLPLPIWDMGPIADANVGEKSIATAMYFYDDKTAIIRLPGKVWEPTTEVAYSAVPPQPIDGVAAAGWIPPDRLDEMTKDWATRLPPHDAVGRCGEPLPYPNDPAATNQSRSHDVHYALHVAGGPYLEWGGGMGRMLKCMNTDSPKSTGQLPWFKDLNINKYLCANRYSTAFKYKDTSLAACITQDKTPEADTMRSVCPQRDKYYQANGKPDETDEPYMTGMALDLSQWEGIAFWARRSPNSQEGIRIAVADKFVDDDMSYLSMKYDPSRPRYCERKVVCGCQNNKPCSSVKAVDNVFDADGHRVKWAATNGAGKTRLRLAVDGDKIDDVEHYPNLLAELSKRHSLINMSGEVIPDPITAKKLTFDDGTQVFVYNGLGANGDGQPYDTDLYVARDESFCFDPAVDPVPPDGTPLSQILNRGFQSTRITASNPTQYVPSSPNGFFYNIAKPGYLDQVPQTDWNGIQLKVVEPDQSELPGYNYTPCGASFCNFEYPSFQNVDPQTWGRSCTPFSYKGGITYSHCYNPDKDPPPPEGSQQCGDFWLKPVALSTNWEFYKVPFSSLLQQGWAKRSYKLDLSSLTDVRIEWDRGWLDVWISDVRFYRTKQQ